MGKDKKKHKKNKHKKHHNDSSDDSGQEEKPKVKCGPVLPEKYGPTLPEKCGPALPDNFGHGLTTALQITNQETATRESWMSLGESSFFEDLSNNNITQEQKAHKEKEKEAETIKIDYSIPGLHILKKPPAKIDDKEYHKNSNTTKLEAMKARIKIHQRSSECSSDKSKSSSFRNPHDRRTHRSPTRSSKERRSLERSREKDRRSRSPHHHRDQSPESPSKHLHLSPDHRRRRSRSPKRSEPMKRLPERSSRTHKSHRANSESSDGGSETDGHKRVQKTLRGEESRESPSPQQTEVGKETESPAAQDVLVTEDDLNILSAKILKAEIMGNTARVEKLKKKFEHMKLMKSKAPVKCKKEEIIILIRTDDKGNVEPVSVGTSQPRESNKRKKEKIHTTHNKDRTRESYFPDDHMKQLNDLVREEKGISKESCDNMFMKYASKLGKMAQDRENWTLDDMYESNIAKTKNTDKKDGQKILAENLKEHKRLESCYMCFDNESCKKDCIVHIGRTLYVKIPHLKSMTSNQCHIVPMQHLLNSVIGDEDFWEELTHIKQKLTKIFSDDNKDVIFLEISKGLKRRKHTYIDCIPISKEDSALAPAYYKKAIMECDVDWAHNKRLVDTRQKGLKRSIPTGMPYFSVEFGIDGGYAHVIEDESLIQGYFGQEIAGGILDCDQNLWRNPSKESDAGINYKKKIFMKKIGDLSG